MEPLFSPPLHKQRHQFVIDFIKKNKTKKVVDLGCSECTLLKMLRFYREIEHLVGLDINGAKLKQKMLYLAPMSTDYLQPSNNQLLVELYEGSVTERDARLRGFDLAVSIELIEHLTLTDVERFSEVLFGYMAPVYVIVSTPNSEFNPLLPGLTGFRHPDHKFEWTRAEFNSWAQKACVDFEYEVDITGVGQAPYGQQDAFGFCSQIAVFHRLKGSCNISLEERDQCETSYTLLYSVNYPSLRDNNILRRVLVSEVLFWAETLKKRWMETKRMGAGEGAEEKQQMTKWSCACGEARPPAAQWRSAAGEGRESEEWWCANARKAQSKNCNLQRRVSVPLSLLWACCPKLHTLSGSFINLRHFLMDEPLVRLSQDGSAVLLDPETGEDEESDCSLEDSGFADVGQNQSVSAEQENWEEEELHRNV